MEQFRKLLEKKKAEGKHLDPMEKESKMSMLKALKNEMGGMMKNDLSPENMKKVTVASNDKQGLAAGLDKAKNMLGQEPQEGMSDGGMVGDKSGPMDSKDHDEYAAKDVAPESDDLPQDPRGEPSGDDEEIEAHIGKYLEDSSDESLAALQSAIERKRAGK